MWTREDRNHADRCLSMVLRVRGLQDGLAPPAGRLLRFLLLWHAEMPAPAGGPQLLLRGLTCLPGRAAPSLSERRHPRCLRNYHLVIFGARTAAMTARSARTCARLVCRGRRLPAVRRHMRPARLRPRTTRCARPRNAFAPHAPRAVHGAGTCDKHLLGLQNCRSATTRARALVALKTCCRHLQMRTSLVIIH